MYSSIIFICVCFDRQQLQLFSIVYVVLSSHPQSHFRVLFTKVSVTANHTRKLVRPWLPTDENSILTKLSGGTVYISGLGFSSLKFAAVRRGRRPDVIRYGETSLLKVDPASSSPSTRRSSSTSVFDKYNSLQTAQDDSDVSPERTSVVEFYSSESATYSSSCQEYSCGPHSPWSHSVPSLPQDRPIIHRQEPHDRLLGNPHLKSNVSVIVYRDRRAL